MGILTVKKYLPKKRRLLFVLLLILLLLAFAIAAHVLLTKKGPALSLYPNGKNFAFTITADPDRNVLEKDKLIYDFFTEVGLRTTIAVWVKDPIRSTGIPDLPKYLKYGDSCERADYLKYMQELQKRGFEIALHTVSSGNDYREETIKGYELFKDYFGTYPNINIMHSTNLENVYWGKKVAENGLIRSLIGLFSKRANIPYSGEVPNSKYFWGDILKKKTKYVRLWGTSDINTLKFNPSMPFHNPKKPYVNFWFSFSDGRDVDIFNKLISKANIERLIKERGTSIVYAHFNGFVNKGELNNTFKRRIKNLTKQKDGWFVPATKILDRILLMRKIRVTVEKNFIYITNFNSCNVDDITLLVDRNELFYSYKGTTIEANDEGEIILKSLKPGETSTLLRVQNLFKNNNRYPMAFDKLKMLIHRALVYIKHNY